MADAARRASRPVQSFFHHRRACRPHASFPDTPFRPASPLVVLFVLLAGCPGSTRNKKGSEADSPPVEEVYQRGVNPLEGGNYDGAASAFQRLISRFPSSVPTPSSRRLNLAYVQQ